MRPAGQRGFSLLEMLVSIAVMAGALIAFYDLIDESLLVLERSNVSARDRCNANSITTLRDDLRSAATLPAGGSPSGGPLDLVMHDGTRITWLRRGGRLIRLERDPSGRESEPQTMARGVTSFRWTIVSPSLVDARLRLEVPPAITGLPSSRPPERGSTTRELRIAASPRGSLGGGAW